MNEKRPKDLIDAIEEIAARNGNTQEVGEPFYRAFLEMTAADVERLTIIVMLNNEKEVRRLCGGKPDERGITKVTRFSTTSITIMSRGLAMIDMFGVYGMTARIGPEPTPDTDKGLSGLSDRIAPWVQDAVRRALPWFLQQPQARQATLSL